MDPERDELEIQKKMEKLLGKPPEYKVSEEKRREFIARLYNTSDEHKHLIDYIPIPMSTLRTFAAVTASILIFILSFNYMFLPQGAYVSEAKGTVKMCRAGTNNWFFVDKPKVALYKNDIVKTFADGQVDIVSSNRYQLRLNSNSEITLAKAPSRIVKGDIKYTLSQGKVFAYYNKMEGKRRNFNIETDEADVTVCGTDFMVASMPALNKTWVGVLDGAVQVASLKVVDQARIKEASVLVKPGEKTVVRAGSVPVTPQRLMENELLEMEELYRIGTKPQVALLISTGRTRTRELLSITPLYISTEKKGALPEKIEKTARQFSQSIKAGVKEKSIENVREFEDIVNRYPNPKYDVQFLLFIGAYYNYLHEYNKAIDTFNRIINDYSHSSLVSIAQCAIGVIYEEKLNDLANAKKAYQKIISNYPKSPEVEEATAGLSRIPQ